MRTVAEATVFYNLISEVTSHPPAHTDQHSVADQGVDARRLGHWRPSWLPHSS